MIETRTSWVVAGVALATMLMAFGTGWITAVALTDIAAEAGGTRSIPALASSRFGIDAVEAWRTRRFEPGAPPAPEL